MMVPAPSVVAAAQEAQRQYDILASVQLGQWALESDWGQKTTGLYNYFGVKAGATQPGRYCPTHEYVNGRMIATTARFRDFTSPTEAFLYHACLLAADEAFRSAWPFRADYVAYVKAMGPHYATDPNYATDLLKVIQGDNLIRFDLPGPPPPPAAAASTPIDQFKKAIGE